MRLVRTSTRLEDPSFRHYLHFGVVPAISAIIKALTERATKVIVQTPVYNCFFSSIRNNGCEALANPSATPAKAMEMDFDDPSARPPTLVRACFCSATPANPAGRVWSRDELLRLARICKANGVTVVSDEIHCELVFKPYKYTPYGTPSRRVLRLCRELRVAKQGIQYRRLADCRYRGARRRHAPAHRPRHQHQRSVRRESLRRRRHHCRLQALARHGSRLSSTICTPTMGQWPNIVPGTSRPSPLCRPRGTYLVWMDVRALGIPSAQLEELLIDDCGLGSNAGTMYGADGEGFMRWNIACPPSPPYGCSPSLRRFCKKKLLTINPISSPI